MVQKTPTASGTTVLNLVVRATTHSSVGEVLAPENEIGPAIKIIRAIMTHRAMKNVFARLECEKIALTRIKSRAVFRIHPIVNKVLATWTRVLQYSVLYGLTLVG